MAKDRDEHPDGKDAQGTVCGKAAVASPGAPLSSRPHAFQIFMEASLVVLIDC